MPATTPTTATATLPTATLPTAAYRAFADRHIGPDAEAQATMLAALGYPSLDALTDAAVPAGIRSTELELPAPIPESAALDELRALARRNRRVTSMIGLGFHPTVLPGVIQRNVLENPAWYTAYTPYQPEISQGRLEALLNFQTMVTDLTGLATAGASLLDESTAAAEAMQLAHRVDKKKRSTFLIDADTLPQTIAVVRTRAEALGLVVHVADLREGIVARPAPAPGEGAAEPLPAEPGEQPAEASGELPADVLADTFGVLLSYPGANGEVRDLRGVIAQARDHGVTVAVAADLLALTLLASPGELGADIAVGTTQRFGLPVMFGGPHAGYMAVRGGLERMLPGRLVGVSVDAAGKPAYRLTLQTREQHIRREKATSNICTAQVLPAVIASMYAVYHGPGGLAGIATTVHAHAARLAEALRAGGVEVVHDHFFDTVLARVPARAAEVVAVALEHGVNLRLVDDDHVGISCNEATLDADLHAAWAAFGVPGPGDAPPAVPEAGVAAVALPAALVRTSGYLEHPVFHAHRSETAMLRYLRRLADVDFALDRGMIPLGSCTMKLNATAEMAAVTWPEFAEIHPFAPLDQAAGYLEMITDLERWLIEITGYAGVSVQPNAGSQGELAGLLAIRAYHRDRAQAGEALRDICLIPSSAHGTNAASAAMAGMKVVVVACDADGNVDLADLAAKAAQHAARLAALMVTYPSTHGVYEEGIGQACAIVHDAGGLVYVDGANLNALVGLARPGRFGADVSHLNLHKTFCIPHGGGGPGVGPVAVGEKLLPYLPNHPLCPEAGPATGVGPISEAPWGSAGILMIPWVYLRLMGAEGVRAATSVAVLNANYIASRLRHHYPVLYAGRGGLVAHECILDLRQLTKEMGVTVDDVAKRLVDYGFHAPTMSFPVAGTLMVEPTESEDLAEIDRFCDAMIAIRAEAGKVGDGTWPQDDNPLRNAPHTAEMVTGDDWDHPYPRSVAAYPVASLRTAKYWPPVRRIDGAYGDRNLVCTCPPPEAFADDLTAQDTATTVPDARSAVPLTPVGAAG
ncbi:MULTISPECIES: aminomethyl-transferring glycine dehydrogenase [unclassified Pseudofrankia]|uniref:aminomethyl-transferring glycine dehydrogenase n=1 Tax=unclassified Pseudofrankia TaxID=2994372 RepID=UPI0008DA142D|nr:MULTISPECIES: aminomethyl-transferring glycine dehydrogenase [unclassified Pseudofrankia]MDT3443691.1 aminomethyl-transferring glycine dehydrogenase [Pseudofrankia sp. BMG5.37]OHV42913.1 glycine dehydrogenase (aminomethyl-transferring) [Pseudofrankia sp. BMG5.36]